MAKEIKETDIYATETAAGLPAYPQVIYKDSGNKYPNGEPIMTVIGTAKDVEEHKKLLGVKEDKKADWNK